ncbi:MAG: hypothetical protein R6U78_17975 [Bacteroidales bacterium]
MGKQTKIRSNRFQKIDRAITGWMASHGIALLRISMGIIFFWFGMLKFFEGLSPAESLAIRTIDILTFGLVGPEVVRYGLAVWEVLIGIGLMFRLYLRETLLLMFLQMLGTLTPVFLFPDEVFTVIPYGLTLEGQYIVKNLVVISAGIVIGATVRGGGIVPEKR